MLWGDAGRSMHETVWKSPLIQDFPAWANWWNSSWNTGNHFTRQTLLKTETNVACPLTQRDYITASYTGAIVHVKAVGKTSLGRTDYKQHKIHFNCCWVFVLLDASCQSSIQWIMSTHHEGHANLYTFRSNCQQKKKTTKYLTSPLVSNGVKTLHTN